MAKGEFDRIMDEKQLEILHETRLDLNQFRAAIRTEAFQPIRVVATGVYFSIEGQMKTPPRPKPKTRTKTREEIEEEAERLMNECMTLCTSRTKKARRFRNPAAALQLLREIGVTKVEVQMQSWYPKRGKQYSDVKRPDMAERLKRAHEAARLEGIGRWEGGGAV